MNKKVYKSIFLIVAILFIINTTLASALEKPMSKQLLDKSLNNILYSYAKLYGEDSVENSTIREIVEIYRNDKMFEMHYEKNPDDAILMVKQVAAKLILPKQQTQDFTKAYIYSVTGVPSYQQVYTNSCGSASALQVIIQQGGGSNITGNTNTDKELALIGQTNLNTMGSVYVYEVRNLINNHTFSGNYSYIECSALSQSTFNTYVRDSFINGKPVILHAMKEYLDYYPASEAGGHYIVGISWRPPQNLFTVNDCNYKSAYYGINNTSMTSAYNSVHAVSGRYLIFGN